MAKIVAVNRSREKGTPKQPLDRGYLIAGHGLEEDAHAGAWHRQISLLGVESINKTILKGSDSRMGIFAENLTTEGILLYELPLGETLKIGETILEVTQIGKECHQGCVIKDLVGDCVMPREGIFARVIRSGWVKAGDEIIRCSH
ncbi:MOSC domain containing protein [Syntrophobotulus glycolicus DSM 8271]|uniref:MOSC domain containing protein n=1 Tax=Syntrophobotulus glycolicus (strain DSM 8271 / FlGlyR) TaxID=645991 RepID=F0T0H0_SYNGF|nr:MOSC domain-containing protein [Syntrophobotulus glycolicus]ADY57342.1 MOSC domain containing protein [Syntrophobotulus glycolicus DSM 8271]